MKDSPRLHNQQLLRVHRTSTFDTSNLGAQRVYLESSLCTPVRLPDSARIRWLAAALLAATLLILPACNRGRHRFLEVAYVSAPQAALRDQVSTAYNRIGNVKNGERVEVLEKEKRFARVRTGTGIEGWIEQRFLVDQQTFDAIQKLTADNQNDPVQSPGTLRNETNLHVTPGREAEHLYQLAAGAKVSILKRATAEKERPPGAAAAARAGMQPGSPAKSVQNRASRASASKTGAKNGAKSADNTPAEPVLEDWWLVRDDQARVGWVLARMVDLDVPLDIAQYAEGQRFVAFFVLNQVQDGDKKVPEYVCALTEPHDGLPYDFDQIRVFTWNVRKHRYETAYREHKLNGMLPVTVSTETFDKEGTLPVFTVQVKDETGIVSPRKYKLNTPIVRRVLGPGEQDTTRMSGKKRAR
jgi:SH3-like domain-containing protein